MYIVESISPSHIHFISKFPSTYYASVPFFESSLVSLNMESYNTLIHISI